MNGSPIILARSVGVVADPLILSWRKRMLIDRVLPRKRRVESAALTRGDVSIDLLNLLQHESRLVNSLVLPPDAVDVDENDGSGESIRSPNEQRSSAPPQQWLVVENAGDEESDDENDVAPVEEFVVALSDGTKRREHHHRQQEIRLGNERQSRNAEQ